jgi:hypothetical protein
MNTFPVALITVRRSAQVLVGSARPDAPVVPDVPRADVTRLVATRGALASLLRRAAERVAPPVCSPAQ